MLKVERDEGFAHFIARQARAASDIALAGWVGAGAIALLAATILRPRAWVLIGSFAALALAFGGWGIAERELDDPGMSSHPVARTAFRAVRVLAVLLALLAAVAIVFAVPMLGIGTVIS